LLQDQSTLNPEPHMSTSTISTTTIPAGSYRIDPAHSSVGFEVRHMGIATVRGAFRQFEGSIDVVDTPVLSGSVDVASIDTGEENRDTHLKSPEFFDSQQHPSITFRTSAIESGDDGDIRLVGDITIKGTTKPIALTGKTAEGGTDPWGNERIGFEVAGVIDRRDFDLKWNQTLPNGNLLVSNDVKLVISVSAVKEA
jgi:polyisoprenoid-binding protein YceI